MYILFPIFKFHTVTAVLGCSVISSFDVNENDVITRTGWEPKALAPATLVLPSCATGCVLESESHQMVNRVRPSRLI